MADLVISEKATLANTGTITDDEAQMLDPHREKERCGRQGSRGTHDGASEGAQAYLRLQGGRGGYRRR